jgi:CheY-like chemotaxis protein
MTESAEGRGSTFTFVFMAQIAAAAPRDASAGDRLSGRRVLVCMPEGIARDQVRSLLSEWGAIPAVWPDGPAAGVEPAGPFDVVLVDGDTAAGSRAAAGDQPPWRGADARVVVITRLHASDSPELQEAQRVLGTPVRARPLYEALCGAVGTTVPPWTSSGARETFSRDSLAVLLVEDNDANRRVVQLMLEELGIDVDQASGGVEAVERACARAYDVILMDLQMPDLDGLEAARRIRAARLGSSPRILALTASVVEGEETRCREAGMDGYLPKPIRLDTLATVLRPFAAGRL